MKQRTDQDVGRQEDGRADFAACRRVADAAIGPTPTEQALAELWPPRPDSASLERLTWYTSVRLRQRHLRLRLDRPDVAMRVESNRVPACQACTDNCCCAPLLVSLRLRDCARLQDLGLGWAIAPVATAAREAILERHPGLRAQGQRDSIRHFPLLAQTPEGRCVFLDDDDRCAIHAIRPLVCRAFPYQLTESLDAVHFNAACKLSRTDGTRAEVESLFDAVLAHHEQKALDLLLLAYAPELLDEVGLACHVPRGTRTEV